MNIKEIAKLAGVSVATVSKVINKKDQNISDETRQKVLRIVKEYNYSPYADVSGRGNAKTFLVGIALDASQEHELLGSLLVERFRKYGYSPIVCRSANPEEELKNLTVLCSHQIDGIVWDRRRDSFKKCEEVLKAKGVPCHFVNSYSAPAPQNTCIDYHELGYAAARHLIAHKHVQIFCTVQSRGYMETQFYNGFTLACMQSSIQVEEPMFCVLDEHDGEVPSRLLLNSTGVICFSENVVSDIYETMIRKNRRIPKYLSVIGLQTGRSAYFYPSLTAIPIPYADMAEHICSRLTAVMDGRRAIETTFRTKARVLEGASVDVPLNLQKKVAVIVGSINMDTYLSLETFPKMGETAMVKSTFIQPGGKALNQAVGISKLGLETHLIGKVGKDYASAEILDYLSQSHVNTEGILRTSKAGTGKAYIHVQSDGESGIVVYPGANDLLTSYDISQNASAFKSANFCLLQTEVNIEAIEYAAQLAYNNDVKILLKPSTLNEISDELIQKTFIFMPNENEMSRLCPSERSYESQAKYFLRKGAKNVIITLGGKGCFWSDGQQSQYFNAFSFQTMDTTGAADAFAAALVVYLIREVPMEYAIRYASFAAGFSTTKLGTCAALIDQATMEYQINSEFSDA